MNKAQVKYYSLAYKLLINYTPLHSRTNWDIYRRWQMVDQIGVMWKSKRMSKARVYRGGSFVLVPWNKRLESVRFHKLLGTSLDCFSLGSEDEGSNTDLFDYLTPQTK